MGCYYYYYYLLFFFFGGGWRMVSSYFCFPFSQNSFVASRLMQRVGQMSLGIFISKHFVSGESLGPSILKSVLFQLYLNCQIVSCVHWTRISRLVMPLLFQVCRARLKHTNVLVFASSCKLYFVFDVVFLWMDVIILNKSRIWVESLFVHVCIIDN